MYDIIIIGAGIIGSSIARNLSQFDLKIAVIEKEADVSLGASKANSGIIHGGYAGKYGTLKGELCIKGNQMYDKLETELNFGFRRLGGMILGFDEEDRVKLEALMENGLKVGQKDFQWLNQKELRVEEPFINEAAKFALFMPSIGVASPYEMTIAMMENAIDNDVELFLNSKVQTIEYRLHYVVKTNEREYESRWVINAAGLESGRLNDFFNTELFIDPRRGQYIVFGKDQSRLVKHVLFQPPTDKGKGILVTQTYHGNFMIGPDAEDLLDDITTNTSSDRIKDVIKLGRKSIPSFDVKRALTTFSGIRAMSKTKDFFIKEVHPQMITVGGIDSPGLTSAPAIAEVVKDMIMKSEGLSIKKGYNPFRQSYFKATEENTVCHCEVISKEEILKTFERGIPINTTDAVKRRVRAGMGTCQGKRCGPVVSSIIESVTGISKADVHKRTESSEPRRVSLAEIKALDV